MPFSFRRDSETRPSQKSCQMAPCFFKSIRTPNLAAFLIRHKLDAAHDLIVLQMTGSNRVTTGFRPFARPLKSQIRAGTHHRERGRALWQWPDRRHGSSLPHALPEICGATSIICRSACVPVRLPPKTQGTHRQSRDILLRSIHPYRPDRGSRTGPPRDESLLPSEVAIVNARTT